MIVCSNFENGKLVSCSFILDDAPDESDEEDIKDNKDLLIYDPNRFLAKESINDMWLKLKEFIAKEEDSSTFKDFFLQRVERGIWSMYNRNSDKIRF